MPLPYRILFYLENDAVILTEIQRLDLPPTEPDPGRLFHWLLFDKATQQLQKLDFVSMNAGPEAQERAFRQGWLRFTAQTGTYAPYGTGQMASLLVRSPAALPPALADAVQAYLLTQ